MANLINTVLVVPEASVWIDCKETFQKHLFVLAPLKYRDDSKCFTLAEARNHI